MHRKLLSATAILAVLTLPALADTYRLTTHGPEAHPLHGNAVPVFAKSVEEASGGRIKFETFMSAALAEGRDTLKAVKNGVAHGGLVVAAYAPSDLPLNNVLSSSSVGMGDQFTATIAITELTFNTPKLLEEWAKAGVVFGGGFSTAPLWLYCTSAVTKPEDWKGKKTWATSGTQAELISAIGGVPVTVSVGDVYSGLQRGSLDCATNDPSGIVKGFRWGEIANNITTIPLGMVTGAQLIYNPDFWNSLSADDRRLLMDQMALGLARMLVDYRKVTKENVEGGKAAGAQILEPTPELIAARDAFNEGYLKKLAEEAVQKRGVEDPTDLIKQYADLADSWAKKLEGVDRDDANAIAPLIKAEIFDKVDVNAYGVSQ